MLTVSRDPLVPGEINLVGHEPAIKRKDTGASLAVWWLRLCTLNARGVGSISGDLRSQMLHDKAKKNF